MKILIVDHKNNLIITEAHKSWAHGFFLHPDLLSSSDKIAQAYIDKWVALENQNNDSEVSSQIEELEIYDINNKNVIQKLEPSQLAPSEDYGLTVISLPIRQMVSLNEYQDIDLLRTHRVQSLLKNSPTEENIAELQKVQILLKKKCIEPYVNGNYAPGFTQELKTYQEKIKTYLENDKAYQFADHEPFYFDLKVSLSQTGWKTWSSVNYQLALNYEKAMKTLYDSGVVVSPKQEKYWHSYFYTNNRLDKLNLDFLSIDREKEILTKVITPQIENKNSKKEKVMKL